MITRLAPLLILPVLLSGCMVRSLQPIYTDKDLVVMPALEGTWKGDEEGKDTFSFARQDDKYLFSLTENEDTLAAVAHFAKIGKRTYMDLTFDESAMPSLDETKLDHQTKSYIQSVISLSTPIHIFYQVEVVNSVFRTRQMNNDWVKTRRDKGHLWIDHIAQGDSALLTADTARVQRFLKRWENSDEAWGEWEEKALIPATVAAKP
ncbi:MAG: hypothetical protein IT366_20805 [Candidatus Hydrogenedentes bacterium]|nr:hypothetical protein [Candidatus Hydrogenedentota bacterium]